MNLKATRGQWLYALGRRREFISFLFRKSSASLSEGEFSVGENLQRKHNHGGDDDDINEYD